MKHPKCANGECISGGVWVESYATTTTTADLTTARRYVCVHCEIYHRGDRIAELEKHHGYFQKLLSANETCIAELEEKHDILRREHDSAITLLRGMSRNIDAFLIGFASDEAP
jgi:hypothetical protein